MDFVDLVAHIFEPDRREFYDLEGLWSDAETIEWGKRASAAGSEI